MIEIKAADPESLKVATAKLHKQEVSGMSHSIDEPFGTDLTKATPALQRRALSLTRNAADAGDLVQDTLLKAWRARRQFEPGTQLQAWLMCIMRNTHLSNLRGLKREVTSGLTDYAGSQIAPASQEWALTAKAVIAALDELPPDQGAAVIHVGLMGETYDEAAARFGCVQGTMKSRVSRARQQLRERCGAQMFARGA